jgi:hypothetical protein
MDQVMSRTVHPKETSHPKETTSKSAIGSNEVKSFLDSITTIAGPAPALTTKDRQRTVRLRKGGEKVVPTILALSERIGLSIPSHPTATIQANLDKVKTLSPVHESLVSAEKHVGDTIFQAQSDAWDGATVHYTMLKRLSKTDGDIAKSLAPVTAFFAHKSPAVVEEEDVKRGHRKGVKEPKASKTKTAATEEPTNAQASVTPTPPASTPAAAPNGATHS